MVNIMAKVIVTQVRGTIDRPADQLRTLKALGLGRFNKSNELELTPQVLGMIKKVNHLVEVKEL